MPPTKSNVVVHHHGNYSFIVQIESVLFLVAVPFSLCCDDGHFIKG